MKYCIRCILPDTRPGISLDQDGICSGCKGHEDKERNINWNDRKSTFEKIAETAKRKCCDYDCIVPVSGGKDSWYQVLKSQEYNLKVLGVTWRTPGRTMVGQRNIDNLIKSLKIDHIEVTIDPEVERRFMIAAYEHEGSTGIPMHMALFAIPLRLAVQMRIPLIIWGENPQLEFGGNKRDRMATNLNINWIIKHGVTNKTKREDWIGRQQLTDKELSAYRLPSEIALQTFSPKSIFLGSFFKWNSFDNYEISSKYGFESHQSDLKTGVWYFADIDCDFIALHHFLKWYKFGFTRSFDNLSLQIRYGFTSRDEAIETLFTNGFDIPTQSIYQFCQFANKPKHWFWNTAEKFRNRKIWSHDGTVWHMPDFLVPNWNWVDQ